MTVFTLYLVQLHLESEIEILALQEQNSERVHSSLLNHTVDLYLFSRLSLQCLQCMNDDRATSHCFACVFSFPFFFCCFKLALL